MKLLNLLQNNYNGSFFFDPEDKIYSDHFPENPVVPGSLIIHAFMEAVKKIGFTDFIAVENFRFKKFISPGEYQFHIEILKNHLKCKLYNKKKVVVTGNLKI
ncbi:3-hydroxyacyl-ACP dehydratase [Candidatus Magnetomoraceae bacterium gMMP-15]